MRCHNCRDVSDRSWCGDCFRAYAVGAFHMLGGLTASGLMGLMAWLLS